MLIKVLLVDDSDEFRSTLRQLLNEESGIEVVGEASGGLEAVHLARELDPDVVLMDVFLPELDGIEATRKIHTAAPEVKVLGLSIHGEVSFIDAMHHAGASGYMMKDSALDQLIERIREIADQASTDEAHYESERKRM